VVTREVKLEWCREHVPDLRIQHKEGVSAARFTWSAHVEELVVEGGNARDAIVDAVFAFIKGEQGDPVLVPSEKDRKLEQQIVAARWRGDDAQADHLTRELLAARAGRPFQVVRRQSSPFGKKEEKPGWQQW
jgi:hypothetical protein